MNQLRQSIGADVERSHVTLAHGGGGRLAQELVDRLFGEQLEVLFMPGRYDGAVVEVAGNRLALATDSFVVNPLFFPGGDIGSLAVYGTVNDLAMCGARPLYLSVGLIVEEGLELDALRRIMSSVRDAAARVNLKVATGDIKVVNRGKGDGLYVNTTGVGVLEHDVVIDAERVQAGDAVLINGDIGRHGIAIVSSREGLGYDRSITSDCAPVVDQVMRLLDAGVEVHCLRDLTRGGLAGRLNEVSQVACARIELREEAIPINPQVREACTFLGLDPYHVPNEGRFVVFVSGRDAKRALELLRDDDEISSAALVGRVVDREGGLVVLEPISGPPRVLDMLSGEHLPRSG